MLDNLKFKARLQGVEVDEEDGEKDEKPEKPKNLMLFKDPKEYEHLSLEEKKALTAKMKGIHQQKIHLGK